MKETEQKANNTPAIESERALHYACTGMYIFILDPATASDYYLGLVAKCVRVWTIVPLSRCNNTLGRYGWREKAR